MKLVLVARVVLGSIFSVLGIMALFGLGPEPPELEGKAGDFMGGLVGSGYFFQFLKIIEIVCGLLLIFGLYVPLALTVLAPIVLNIVLFHAFLARTPDAVVGVVALLLGLYLARAYRSSFAGVLNRSAQPD